MDLSTLVNYHQISFFLCLKVVRAKKKDTGIVYALKIMDKKFITKENKTAYVKLERIVLDQLDHPGIVRLYFTFQDSFSLCKYSWMYVIFTLAYGLTYSSLIPSQLFLLLPSFAKLVYIYFDIIFFPFSFYIGEDMALESCEGGELFDQITRVS